MTLKLAYFLLVMFTLVIGSLSARFFKSSDIPEKQANWMGAKNERIVDNYWTPTEDTMDHDIYFNENNNDAIKVVMPPLHYNLNSDKVTEQYYQKEEEKQNTVQYARKPKTITRFTEVSFAEPKKEEKDFIIKIFNDDEVNGPNPCKPSRFVQAAPKDKQLHYEVTEGNLNDVSTATTMKNYGYFPKIPRYVNKEGHNIFLNTGKNNKTNTLQKILSLNSYSNDNLKNYEISRRTQMYFLPIQFNTPKRKFNRQNNLPVDPLIAVLLSNYGIYLPQFYKTNSGYKNLYGHLAFNNIHNNNPFGSYKLYSDTDYDYDDTSNQ